MAHEINNPVVIMVEEAGRLLDFMHEEAAFFVQSPHRQEYLRVLQQIDTQGRRCKEITTKLLDFARRSDAPPPAPPDQRGSRRGGRPGGERPARYLNVDLSLDLATDLPPFSVSPSELQQVLINLVNNAVDAMEKTGGQGGGFHQPRRWEIKGRWARGTGLGLSICYGIVQKLGGRIEVESFPGRGATFLVHLPVAAKPV